MPHELQEFSLTITFATSVFMDHSKHCVWNERKAARGTSCGHLFCRFSNDQSLSDETLPAPNVPVQLGASLAGNESSLATSTTSLFKVVVGIGR